MTKSVVFALITALLWGLYVGIGEDRIEGEFGSVGGYRGSEFGNRGVYVHYVGGRGKREKSYSGRSQEHPVYCGRRIDRRWIGSVDVLRSPEKRGGIADRAPGGDLSAGGPRVFADLSRGILVFVQRDWHGVDRDHVDSIKPSRTPTSS